MTTLLERREIEALFAKAVYEELAPEIGEAAAEDILGRVARKLAIAHGGALAEEDGDTGLDGFHRHQDKWREGGALEIENIEVDDRTLAFNVNRCRYAEMYERLGMRHLGAALSCNRDGSLCEGYDPRIRMTRTQTIMQGHGHCDFRYTLDDD